MSEPISIAKERRLGKKFRITVEILDEEYTDHWVGEWKVLQKKEVEPDFGHQIASVVCKL